MSVTVWQVAQRRYVLGVHDQDRHYYLQVKRAIGETALQEVLQVARQTGQMWLVGPDSAGWSVVRIAGNSKLVPARELSVIPPVQQLAANPDDVPVIHYWAKAIARKTAFTFSIFLFVFVLVCVGAVWSSSSNISLLQIIFLLAITSIIFLLVFLLLLRRSWPLLKLPKLTEHATWQKVSVPYSPQNFPNFYIQNSRSVIRQQHGPDMIIRLPQVNLDLATNIQATGTLWVAEPIVPGKLAAVGFPGYPVLSYAYFSPIDRSSN